MLAVVFLAGCGGGDDRAQPPPTRATPPPPAPAPPRPAPTPRFERLAIGVAETNPHLIAPGAVPRAFRPWRDRLVALRPRFFRLVFKWAAFQPVAGRAPNWSARTDGCMRGVKPCAPYRGLRDLLRAVRERQDANGGWEVVVSPWGAPDWALRPVAGCPGGRGRMRLAPYRAMLRSLAALGRREGVRLTWWSPWNEPNHPYFLAPQRNRCKPGARSRAPRAYARLVRAAREELPAGARLVLGEIAGFDSPRPEATGAAEFAAGLPRDVACASDVWAQHTYVGEGTTRLGADLHEAGDPEMLRAVRRALDRHECRHRHRIWVTETGAFPGARGCEGMTAALRSWQRDGRVDAAFQYTFREDTAFRVGLADARLRRTLPPYRAWRGWAERSSSDSRGAGEACRG